VGEVGFYQNSNHWLDIDIFENRVKHILTKPFESLKIAEVEQLENAFNLHKDELLEGFYVDWALHERERLRSLYVKGQIHLFEEWNLFRYDVTAAGAYRRGTDIKSQLEATKGFQYDPF
jgi:two-component SAPR family response regulator